MSKIRLSLSTQEIVSMRVEDQVADPKEVTVFVSTFDDDDFLLFKRLNGTTSRKSLSTSFFEAAQGAYRTLWKEELDAVPMRYPNGKLDSIEGEPPEFVSTGLKQAVELCERGKGLLGELEGLIRDLKSPPQRLGQVTEALEEIDKNIEHVGLSQPVLGALIRMFIMEKENMRGDDPLKLASEMRVLYDTLHYRANKFGKLFAMYSAAA